MTSTSDAKSITVDKFSPGTTYQMNSVSKNIKEVRGATNISRSSDDANGAVKITGPDLWSYSPKAMPMFSGTVVGISNAHVSLSNVDDTSDACKPIGTPTRTTLNGT